MQTRLVKFDLLSEILGISLSEQSTVQSSVRRIFFTSVTDVIGIRLANSSYTETK